MFHKPKADGETLDQDRGQFEQDNKQQGLSIDGDAEHQPNNEDDVQMTDDSNTQHKDTADTQQQSGQEGQGRQADIPAAAGAYRGSQQIPNAERMQQPGMAAAAPYAAMAERQFQQTEPQASVEENAQGRRLVVGRGITMSGEIEACDHLVVEGTVEAALKGASVLEISETGVFYGSVEIDEAVVAGRFEGELSVNGQLSVRTTGSITGTISYKELAIEAGALLDGKISPIRGEKLSGSGKGAAKSDSGKAGKAKKDGDNAGDKDSSGAELPFSNEAVKDSSAA
jgi:cytoskeletal protein CcmA (bactofilin family)